MTKITFSKSSQFKKEVKMKTISQTQQTNIFQKMITLQAVLYRYLLLYQYENALNPYTAVG